MSHSPLVSFKGRLVLTILLSGMILAVGLFGLGGQPISWAAPAQHPHLQTVPTRPPDEPPSLPPDSGPPVGGALAPPAKRDDGDNSPAQPSEQPANQSQDESQSTPPLEQQDSNGQAKVQSTPTPKQESGKNQNQAPPTPASNGDDEENGALPATIKQADLSLSQTVNNPTPNLHAVITFTITISNNGPSKATNVIASDPLPLGLILSSTIPSQGKYDGDTGLWAVETITQSKSVTLSLVVTVTSAGMITNNVEIMAAHPSDPDSTPGNGFESEDDWTSLAIGVLETSPSYQSDSDTLRLVSASTGASVSLLGWTGSLSWLYALCLGLILILSGIYLVHRA